MYGTADIVRTRMVSALDTWALLSEERGSRRTRPFLRKREEGAFMKVGAWRLVKWK